MPHALIALLFFLAQPFWEAKTPQQWSDEEIDSMRRSSPWVQTSNSQDPPIYAYLATAAPIQEAESEVVRRNPGKYGGPDHDYAEFLKMNQGKVVVLAIPWRYPDKFGTAAEQKRMVDGSVMM